MKDLFFALKMLGVTVLIVSAMQIRIGDMSLEEHANEWAHSSAPVMVLREVSEGGLAAAHDVWVKLTSNIKTKYWQRFDKEKIPGHRQLNFSLERSEEYIEEQKAKAEELAAEQKKKKEKLQAELSARGKKVKEALGFDDELDVESNQITE